MHETIEADFRIVTPMFLGSANQDVSDGIRPPSIKGALRFWWRALQWGRFRQETSCDETALILLHDEEVRLFGDAAEQGGQGCFLLSVSKQPGTAQTVRDWPVNNTGAGYLAFGILESGNHAKGNYQPHRNALKEGRSFQLRLAFRPKTSREDIESVLSAMEAWSLFGGLGSRARRGMGSVIRLTENKTPLTRVEYEERARALLADYDDTKLAPYTAFSKDSLFGILSSGRDARATLGEAGAAYKNHRGQESSLRGADKIPFGLPLQGVDENSRRASPLFFHVHAAAEDQYIASILYLPAATFHPRYPSVSLEDVAGFAQGASV